ncbi:WD40 repeat domain-containing protein [Amycolatopsis sp. NPDC059021]|uniref:WD40 repeat domain-containing protein n=1 Tax=Amycolatopsis sp. NPDC059021 TaxID=3346704 RepID=UPI0036707E9E
MPVQIPTLHDGAGLRYVCRVTFAPLLTEPVRAVAFSPDGHTVATSSDDHTARLGDTTDPHHPSPLATLTDHMDHVGSVAFTPDGRTLATADDDYTARLWDITDQHAPAVLATLTGHGDSLTSAAFSPDGQTLATASLDHSIRLWDTDAERVATRICTAATPTITPAEWNQHFPNLTYHPPCLP